MSNPQIIQRANENSSLFNTIKARNSKQNAFDYPVGGESNVCPFVKSVEIATPQSSMNNQNQQTLKIPLPNHGLLYDLYLKTKFSTPGADGTNHTDAGHGVALTNWAGAWSWTKCRLVYQGVTLFEWTPEWVMTSQYSRSNRERALQLDHMMGGSILGIENDTPTALVGRRAAATSAGGIHLLAPLKGFFSDGLGRALDLYSLNSTVFLEVDYRSNANTHEILELATNFCGYDGCEAHCKLIELSPQELSAYQARNYVPGSVSSQLGFTTTHLAEAVATPVLITGSSQVGNKIKLSGISGLVRRLFVYATLDADTTAKKYFIPVKLSRVRLLANNSVIHEQLETSSGDVNSTSNGYRGDIAMEAFSNNLPMSYGGVLPSAFDPMAGGKASDAAAGGTARIADGECDISRVVVVNFALNPDDYSSADGLVSFQQISGGGPELEVFFDTVASTNPHTIHVVAEISTITTYNTSNTGSISIKSITE
mgnify:FL=1